MVRLYAVLPWFVVACSPEVEPGPALEAQWSRPDGPVIHWRSPQGAPPRLADVRRAQWGGVDTLLGLVVLTATQPDGRNEGLSLLDSGEVVDLARREHPDHPLLPAASTALELRRSGTWASEGDPPDSWLRHVAFSAALEHAPDRVEDRSKALLAVWPAHPDACRWGALRARGRGDFVAMRAFLDACTDDRALDGLRADWLDAVGHTEAAIALWQAVGRDHHAQIAACVDLPDAVTPFVAPPTVDTALVMAGCVDTPGLAVDHQALRALLVHSDTPTMRLAAAALALRAGEGTEARAALQGLRGLEADTLRGSLAVLDGDLVMAERYFAEARAAAPMNLHVLRAMSHAGPAAVREVERILDSVVDPWAWLVEASERDRVLPWTLLVPPVWGPVQRQDAVVAIDSTHHRSRPLPPVGDSRWLAAAAILGGSADCDGHLAQVDPALWAMCVSPAGREVVGSRVADRVAAAWQGLSATGGSPPAVSMTPALSARWARMRFDLSSEPPSEPDSVDGTGALH